jgi:hypothetical protein
VFGNKPEMFEEEFSTWGKEQRLIYVLTTMGMKETGTG